MAGVAAETGRCGHLALPGLDCLVSDPELDAASPQTVRPWAALLALFSSACVWLLKCIKDIKNELEEERFSAPKALALGYLNNWVRRPLIFC